ncbi:MAG TPA: DEAD/DEAH box helicase, partial [Ktedonobacterales bacterium]|nr:DEAD/DEAH box helicase [Ktedonobacterales bacterium]
MASEEQAEEALREIVRGDFVPGGVLAKTLPGYEERPAQVTMAQRVSDALESGEHLAAEASTGTGKSIAYLIPIIRSGKVALISTANKALQEQLYYKDIPFVQKHVAPFEAALVKGMGNYLCLDRFTEEESFQQLTGDLGFKAMVEQMGDFDQWNGDIDLLSIPLRNDLRGRIVAD